MIEFSTQAFDVVLHAMEEGGRATETMELCLSTVKNLVGEKGTRIARIHTSSDLPDGSLLVNIGQLDSRECVFSLGIVAWEDRTGTYYECHS